MAGWNHSIIFYVLSICVLNREITSLHRWAASPAYVKLITCFVERLFKFVDFLFQRVTQICKLLGKSDEIIQRKLQGYLSMDSIDGFLSNHIGDGPVNTKAPMLDNNFHKNSSDSDLTINGRQLDNAAVNYLKSDTESGFDESSSQMSRSGIDEVGICNGLEASSLVRSPSSEQLSVDQLLAELKTVAIGWKSFRNVQNCSCATPFDYDVKKVR